MGTSASVHQPVTSLRIRGGKLSVRLQRHLFHHGLACVVSYFHRAMGDNCRPLNRLFSNGITYMLHIVISGFYLNRTDRFVVC